MTVYVTTYPHAPDAYHLWATTPDEALCAAFACGADMPAHRPYRSELHWELNWQQVNEAVQQGAQRADKYAALEAAALYVGNATGAASVRNWRANETRVGLAARNSGA